MKPAQPRQGMVKGQLTMKLIRVVLCCSAAAEGRC